MRSIFLETLSDYDDKFVLKTKDMHHLVNVVRVKLGEKLRAFDRYKNIFEIIVTSLTKKEISFDILNKTKAQKSPIPLLVAFGKIKKESLDLSLKQLVEIGVEHIYIFNSHYSQKYKLKPERLDKIVISAMEQSNNYLFPEIHEVSIDELKDINKKIIYFSSKDRKHQKIDGSMKNSLIVIGPEGGLSNDEEKILDNQKALSIHLPTNIMRASTAISFCSGYVLAAE